MFHLGKTEEGTDETDAGGTSPNVAAFSSNVPSGLVEELRGEVDHWDFADVVCSAADTGREGAETHGRGLGDDSVRNGAHGEGEDEGDDDSETRLGVVGVNTLLDRRRNSQTEQGANVERGTAEVNLSTGEVGRQRQGENIRAETQARVDETQLK